MSHTPPAHQPWARQPFDRPHERAGLDLRLRKPTPGLLALPWREPLADWDLTAVPFRDVPVGPSRHLVKFIETDGQLWALKALPQATALREYRILRGVEGRALAAVRASGVVVQPHPDAAILVTEYLHGSWQYRRLLMRVPVTATVHRRRLFDAMAVLLVDLHRNGIYWGDCSLANTLFMRDGQVIQAWMVDAETAELHPSLSDGQRRLDLSITVENVAGGLFDVAARRGEVEEASGQIVDEAESIAVRYAQLWDLLHDRPTIGLQDQHEISARLRALNDAGFAVDEVRLEAANGSHDDLHMNVAVAERTFHSEQLRSLTGLEVGEGQATILLNDVRAHHGAMQQQRGGEIPERLAAGDWLIEVFTPRSEHAHRALGGHGDATQAYCDLLEVRWLLSEQAGADVGDGPALEALASRGTPGESAANLAFVDLATEEVPALTPNRPDHLAQDPPPTD